MKPELYVDQRSPPVRSTILLVKTLGLDDVDIKPIDLAKGEHLTKSFLEVISVLIPLIRFIFDFNFIVSFAIHSGIQMNPCHTVPTFHDDHVTLTDSHSILIYLCEKYGGDLGKKLYPTDPIDRINVLNKLFYSGTLLFRRDSDAVVSICFEQSQ